MKVALVVVLLVLAGCGGSASSDSASNSNTRPDDFGNPAVYRRIETTTSCTQLHREFQIAADNASRFFAAGEPASVPLSYMGAASNRMIEVGCYG